MGFIGDIAQPFQFRMDDSLFIEPLNRKYIIGLAVGGYLLPNNRKLIIGDFKAGVEGLTTGLSKSDTSRFIPNDVLIARIRRSITM
ncbi:MAG: hypothetical protein BGO59_17770 [Spirosoma sp. 48-14]|nr:MAG: hypothetical protein BGO59_17770 [Spirosoma sp. 48-14]